MVAHHFLGRLVESDHHEAKTSRWKTRLPVVADDVDGLHDLGNGQRLERVVRSGP